MKSSEIRFSEGKGEEGSDAQIEMLDLSSPFPNSRAVLARAMLWWHETPRMDEASVGCIGSFYAEDENAGIRMLDFATDHLRQCGCQFAVGPMHGNTWRNYRYVTENFGRGAFFLEPRNHPDYPIWWQRAGFAMIAEYSSSLILLDGSQAVSPALRSRIERSGVVIRKIDLTHYEDELRRIHTLSLKCFANNFLYTPLSENEFLTAYLKVRDRVDLDFVRIAEQNGVVCGYVFGIPDFESAARGEKPTLIVKTLAVDPAAGCAGLGSLLVDEVHRSAHEKGYVEAIHALQHQSNTSLKITGRHQGTAIRKYALFGKKL